MFLLIMNIVPHWQAARAARRKAHYEQLTTLSAAGT